MAVIKAVSSKAGIGHAIDYVTKKEKTEEKLVSGLHCEPETVKEEMQATKELWGKTDGRTYKHYVQSYHEDEEITPEQAHKNAVELAEHTKAWKGHEVLIATHIDKGHIHTHFIVFPFSGTCKPCSQLCSLHRSFKSLRSCLLHWSL